MCYIYVTAKAKSWAPTATARNWNVHSSDGILLIHLSCVYNWYWLLSFDAIWYIPLFYVEINFFNRGIPTYFIYISEVQELRDSAQVETLQDQAQLMLRDYILQQYPTNKFRFGKLLLILPALKTIRPRTIEDVFFRRTIGSVPVERLLCDMFKSS